MRVKIELMGDREVSRLIHGLARKAGVVGDDFADYAAKIAQRSAVMEVQPFGDRKAAQGLGEGAIWRSLHNTFKIVPNNYRGNDIMTGMSAARQAHQAARNSRGRVGHVRLNRPKIKYQLFQQYAATVIAKVGKAKGGFANNSKRLGARIPAWVKRHADSAGRVTRRKGARGVEWSFDNEQKYTRHSWVLGQGKLNALLNKQNKLLYNSFKGKLRRAGIMV